MKIPCALALSALLTCGTLAAEPRVLKVLQDFESGFRLVTMTVTGLAVEASTETKLGMTCLKVTVERGFPWRWKGWGGQQDQPLESVRLAILSSPYLPPEADAVRMRVRVASGRAIVSVGGPVSQLGNSDVWCDPQLLEAGGWRTVEFSLNQPLVRNFRRPNFTADLPVIYYTRWAQEPLYLQLLALPEDLRPTEDTVLFIDQVELLARGEGRPFPAFAAGQVNPVGLIADFEAEGALSNVWAVGHGYSIVKAFEAGYRRRSAEPEAKPMPEHIRKSSPFIPEEGLAYPAPRFTQVAGPEGRRALRAEGVWAEEGQIVTFKTAAPAEANALTCTLQADFPAARAGLYAFTHEGQPAQAVDIVVLVAPPGGAFPWADLEATEELKQAFVASGYQGPGAKYDYLMVAERCPPVKVSDLRQAGDFGFYVARRHVPARAWSTLVIPFADFVCVYGQGACQAWASNQVPLNAASIAAVGLLAPYGSGHGTLMVDELAYARVPGQLAELRSYWQVPAVSGMRLHPLPRFSPSRPWRMMTPADEPPDFMK